MGKAGPSRKGCVVISQEVVPGSAGVSTSRKVKPVMDMALLGRCGLEGRERRQIMVIAYILIIKRGVIRVKRRG